MPSAECPFCAPEPPRIVTEDALTVTIRDAFPISPGHLLIVPRRHVASWFDATDDEQLAMLRALRAARDGLVAERAPAGFNVGINDGVVAGQTILHLHVHLIPRYPGDTPDPRGGVRYCIPGVPARW